MRDHIPLLSQTQCLWLNSSVFSHVMTNRSFLLRPHRIIYFVLFLVTELQDNMIINPASCKLCISPVLKWVFPPILAGTHFICDTYQECSLVLFYAGNRTQVTFPSEAVNICHFLILFVFHYFSTVVFTIVRWGSFVMLLYSSYFPAGISDNLFRAVANILNWKQSGLP